MSNEVKKAKLLQKNSAGFEQIKFYTSADVVDVNDLVPYTDSELEGEIPSLISATNVMHALKIVDGIGRKTKKTVDGLATVAKTNRYSDLDGLPVIPTKVSELSNDLNFVKNSTYTTDLAGKLGVDATAASAAKLTVSDGSSIHPVYFKDGVPVAINHTINASVPANAVFTDTTYSVMTAATNGAPGASGLVPQPAAGDNLNKFLCGDATWKAIPIATNEVSGLVKVGSNITNTNGAISLTKANVTSALGYTPPTTDTTYEVMGGASANGAGSVGLVPQPAAGKHASFLRGDGTWDVPTDTKYSEATASELGLVKIGSNITNNAGTISLTKANVTDALGYTPPTVNTTYNTMTAATSSTPGTGGLVPQPVAGKQASFLRGDGTWAIPTDTKYSEATDSELGLVKVGSNITNTNGTISLTKANVTDALGYTPPTTDTKYSNATASTAGLIKVSSVNTSAVTVNAETATAGRFYAVELNSDGKAIVNVPWTDNNTTYDVATTTANGLMASGDKTNLNSAIKNLTVSGKVITFTKVDGSTGTLTTQDTNTTYNNMVGASGSAAGAAGLVPQPAAGAQAKFLRGDGTWAVPDGAAIVEMTNDEVDAILNLSGEAYNPDDTTYAIMSNAAIDSLFTD